MQNAILYQAYGGIDFINECRYSLLKYLQVYDLKPPVSTGIYIYTDTPHLFEAFKPFFPTLEFIAVTEEMIRQWKGPAAFVHRFKIEMIRHFLQGFDGNLLYCDTDTYAVLPLEDLFDDIANGHIYMHEYEGVIDGAKFPSFRKWEKFLSTTPIRYNEKQLAFHKRIQMFNAGVIGLHSSKKEFLNDILLLTDSIYQKFPKHIAEQFAFSFCLQQEATINEAKKAISHYWNLKEFRQLLHTFFIGNQEESIPFQVKKLQPLDALPIMHQKMTFQQAPLFRRLIGKLTGSAWHISQYEKKL
jgi:hypothetical protein